MKFKVPMSAPDIYIEFNTDSTVDVGLEEQLTPEDRAIVEHNFKVLMARFGYLMLGAFNLDMALHLSKEPMQGLDIINDAFTTAAENLKKDVDID